MSSAQRGASIEAYGTARNSDLLAYTLLEIARLRCERLLHTAPGDRALNAIHRDLGLAGYYASAELHPAVRTHCLAVAHAQSELDVHSGRRAALDAMFEGAASACDALTAALVIAAADHLHLAHLHLSSAAESLDRQMHASSRLG